MQAKEEDVHLQDKATGSWSSADPARGLDQHVALTRVQGQMPASDGSLQPCPGVSEHELPGALNLPNS